MKISQLSKALALCTFALVVTGCSSFLEVGEDPTECPATANGGIPCTSARDIWKLTDNMHDLEVAKAAKAEAANPKRNGDEIKEESFFGSTENDHSEHEQAGTVYPGGTPSERQAIYADYTAHRNSMAAPEPIAVRQRAKVLRVLMNSWEDDNGRLHMPGYTYVEVEPRKWVVGLGAITNPARITPLSIRKQSLTDERRNNPVADNSMGIIQPAPLQGGGQNPAPYRK